MKSESVAVSKSIDLGNLGVIAPHKAKYYDRYNMSWLIGAANAGMQLKYVTFWHEGVQQPQEPAPDAADAALLMKLLQNPEMAALIKTLAKTLQ